MPVITMSTKDALAIVLEAGAHVDGVPKQEPKEVSVTIALTKRGYTNILSETKYALKSVGYTIDGAP